MSDNEAIINPVKGKSSPNPGSLAVLVATRGDLFSLCRLLNLKKDYGYLYKQYRKPRKDDNLAEIYENINLQIYDIIGIDLTLLISYKSYINEYNKLHSEIITNRKNNIELH